MDNCLVTGRKKKLFLNQKLEFLNLSLIIEIIEVDLGFKKYN